MSVFVVFTGSEKQDIVNPDVVGPFASEDEAVVFLKRHPRMSESAWGLVLEPINGGYAGFAVVSERSAVSPAEYVDMYFAEDE